MAPSLVGTGCLWPTPSEWHQWPSQSSAAHSGPLLAQPTLKHILSPRSSLSTLLCKLLQVRHSVYCLNIALHENAYRLVLLVKVFSKVDTSKYHT